MDQTSLPQNILSSRACEIVSCGLHFAVIQVLQTEAFSKWLRGLRDRRAVARIVERLRRLALGNPGDVKPVGDGLSELRVDYGPGYRVYFARRGEVLIVVLRGGEKASQGRDITRAKALAKEIDE